MPDKIARAMAYPFAAPDRSYVYVNGEALPLAEFHRDHPSESLIDVPGGQISLAHHLRVADIDPTIVAEPRLPVIASGSNASPLRLAQKFTRAFQGGPRDVVIPVVRADLHDFAPVYSAHISGYGSIPATLQHTAGIASTVFVTWLTPAQLDRMHETEALGMNYGFARIGGIRLAFPDALLDRAFAYISLRGSLHVEGDHFTLDPAHAGRAGLQPVAQKQIQALVRDLVAPGMPLDGFVAENIRDEATRRKRIRLLRAFSHPIMHGGIAFDHGPAAKLLEF
jgi:hypothetical protein